MRSFIHAFMHACRQQTQSTGPWQAVGRWWPTRQTQSVPLRNLQLSRAPCYPHPRGGKRVGLGGSRSPWAECVCAWVRDARRVPAAPGLALGIPQPRTHVGVLTLESSLFPPRVSTASPPSPSPMAATPASGMAHEKVSRSPCPPSPIWGLLALARPLRSSAPRNLSPLSPRMGA